MQTQNQSSSPRGYKKYSAPAQKKKKPFVRPAAGNPGTAKQLARHMDLMTQFYDVSNVLVGRSTMVVLPGQGSQHLPDMFRPVHREPPMFWRRPQFVVMSVVAGQRLTMTVVESRPSGAKLVYTPTHVYDFGMPPKPDATGDVLDCNQHVLLTVGNNLLQELVNTAELPVSNLVLPQLVIMTDVVNLDEIKLARLAQKIEPPELRFMYAQKRRESAEIVSLGERFVDAELARDEEIATAFRQKRAYENYEDLLGAEEINPARRIFMARNPAKKILREANLPAGWAESADESLMQSLLLNMRQNIPMPEIALDDDLVEGLANPDKPLQFSASLDQLPLSIILRAMRSAIPGKGSLRYKATDNELLAAARNPDKPLIVHAYSRVQLFPTEQLTDLPNYAAGSFFPVPKPQELNLASE